MGRQGQGDAVPTNIDVRMVLGRLRHFSHCVDESNGFQEVREFIGSLQEMNLLCPEGDFTHGGGNLNLIEGFHLAMGTERSAKSQGIDRRVRTANGGAGAIGMEFGETIARRLGLFISPVFITVSRMAEFIPPSRVNVLGVGISAVNLETTLDAFENALAAGVRGFVTCTGVHGVMESQDSEAIRQIHNRSLMSTPDGMPMVWLLKWAGHSSANRVYGPELMEYVMKASPTRGWTHFLYGGKEGVAEKLKSALEQRFPGVRIVGTYTPPFRALSEAEFTDLATTVERLSPDFFWVGLSCPRQEIIMAEYEHRLAAKIFLGVGAAFDFHTGEVRQAPRWIQRSGFEWLYRLASEPRRLAKRYLRNNPRFVWRILGQMTGLRRVPSIEPGH